MYNNNSVICVLFNSRSKKFKKMVENLENLLTFLNNLDYLDIFIYIFIVYLIYFGWKKGSVLIIYYLIAFLVSIYLSFTYSFLIDMKEECQETIKDSRNKLCLTMLSSVVELATHVTSASRTSGNGKLFKKYFREFRRHRRGHSRCRVES